MPDSLGPRASVPVTKPRLERLWWLLLAAIWALASGADRLWLRLDQRLPSWDQADYLNSAVDHGRALGLLPGGGWPGWDGLLDLSPKIPPLASLVNGSVMALSGDLPDQAMGVQIAWHGLLLFVVALWGRQLLGRGFGLLCAALVALAPALAAQRVDFTLDLPLTACSMLALWRLGLWQAPAPRGGRWHQALAAAVALAAALLVKQSALLVLALPALWAAGRGLQQSGRRAQVPVAVAIVLALLLPWLHHNWITTLGGTNRAVVESARAEGDPSSLSLASLLWYGRLWPGQLGPVILLPGLAAGLGSAWRHLRQLPAWLRRPGRHLPPGWPWLIGCCLSGWLCTTLSPNKDARYIAPVLPLLLMLLARGWWQIGLAVQRRCGRRCAAALLGAGLLAGGAATAQVRGADQQRQPGAPVPDLAARLRQEVGSTPTTVVMLPSSPELNEHTLTTYGRLGGGRIVARRLGKRRQDHALVLERSDWLVLATGDQGSRRAEIRELSQRVRRDGRFERVANWPWSEGRRVELWRRRSGQASRFDADFIALAGGMARGPEGLARVFGRIGNEHLLDGHFLYQQRVRSWAEARLQRDPRDAQALWSLALLATLQNRPAQAVALYDRLGQRDPTNPWPRAYGAVVRLADWNPTGAQRTLAEAPASVRNEPVNRALGDLSAVLSGRLNRAGALGRSLPPAIEAVKGQLGTR